MLYADDGISFLNLRFENDVKVDGTQTERLVLPVEFQFENDVKVDGTQTPRGYTKRLHSRLRMM